MVLKPFASPLMLKVHLIINKQELKNCYAARKITSLLKKKVSLTDLKKRRWKGKKGGKGLYTKEIKAEAQNPTTWPHPELKALLWQYITKVFLGHFSTLI